MSQQHHATALGAKSECARLSNQPLRAAIAAAAVSFAAVCGLATAADSVPAPTAADRVWLLGEPSAPEDNQPNGARIELGKALFFDPRLSGNGTVSCASCHNPALGWSGGLPTGVGITTASRSRPTSSP